MHLHSSKAQQSPTNIFWCDCTDPRSSTAAPLYSLIWLCHPYIIGNIFQIFIRSSLVAACYRQSSALCLISAMTIFKHFIGQAVCNTKMKWEKLQIHLFRFIHQTWWYDYSARHNQCQIGIRLRKNWKSKIMDFPDDTCFKTVEKKQETICKMNLTEFFLEYH